MPPSGVEIPTNLFSILQPFIIITRIGGFCPISYLPKGPNYLLQWSPWYTLYSYALALFTMLWSLICLSEDLNASNSIRMKNSTVKYVTLVDLGEVMVTVFIGMAVTPFKLRYLWVVLDRLRRLDGVAVGHAPGERRRVLVLLSVGIGAPLVVIGYELYLWGELSWRAGQLGVFMKRYFVLFSTYFLVFIQEMPYWNFVRLIRKRIQGLNGILEKGVKEIGESCGKVWVCKKKKSGEEQRFLSYSRVSSLIKLYEYTDEAVQATNSYCAISILLILMSCLLHLVVTPYFLLVEVSNGGYFIFIFLQFSWTMLHAGRLLVIVETCQTCIDENQKTMDLVYKLLTSELPDYVKIQLKMFALQLSAKKMKFSAFSLMKIDRSLLTTIAGSVTTFLVILFQFGKVGSDVYYSRD